MVRLEVCEDGKFMFISEHETITEAITEWLEAPLESEQCTVFRCVKNGVQIATITNIILCHVPDANSIARGKHIIVYNDGVEFCVGRYDTEYVMCDGKVTTQWNYTELKASNGCGE